MGKGPRLVGSGGHSRGRGAGYGEGEYGGGGSEQEEKEEEEEEEEDWADVAAEVRSGEEDGDEGVRGGPPPYSAHDDSLALWPDGVGEVSTAAALPGPGGAGRGAGGPSDAGLGASLLQLAGNDDLDWLDGHDEGGRAGAGTATAAKPAPRASVPERAPRVLPQAPRPDGGAGAAAADPIAAVLEASRRRRLAARQRHL